MDEVTIVHKNHKMNNNQVYEYNGIIYKLSVYLSGKSITKEIEKLLGKKDNFMLINIMMQNDNISFKNKNQSERKKTLMQLLDLEKYEKIKKEVGSKYLEEKIKREKLESKIKDTDIIEIEKNYKKNIENIKDQEKSLIIYNEKINEIKRNKEELIFNYTKIDEDKIKKEENIKEEIRNIITENKRNEDIKNKILENNI